MCVLFKQTLIKLYQIISTILKLYIKICILVNAVFKWTNTDGWMDTIH